MQDINVNLIDTGIDTKTGGRIKRLSEYLKNERFFLTYGDGLSNVNILDLLAYHKNKNNLFNLSPKGNLKEAAKNLYKIFRAIKKLKYKKINVVKIPNKGIGVAINDRLKKASR